MRSYDRNVGSFIVTVSPDNREALTRSSGRYTRGQLGRGQP